MYRSFTWLSISFNYYSYLSKFGFMIFHVIFGNWKNKKSLFSHFQSFINFLVNYFITFNFTSSSFIFAHERLSNRNKPTWNRLRKIMLKAKAKFYFLSATPLSWKWIRERWNRYYSTAGSQNQFDHRFLGFLCVEKLAVGVLCLIIL